MEISRIHQLTDEVIGQIAAGEVVERPASAIKELVENSMDAGATAISVEIRDGGVSFLKVTDNGKGILSQDIRLAFARHATSKIRNASDIYGVRTLGFRGEALASVAAVSRVQLVTRARGNETGIMAINEAGVITELKDAACPEGTSITVKDLFFNAPVRLKFLRKPSFETAAVSDLIAALIISHPEISFRFKADGKTIYFSAGDGTVDSAVLCVFGLDVLKQLNKVSGSMSGVMLDGFVGVGELARGNRSRQYFFLNGRLMKSSLLSGALENACRQRVMTGRFPICMLFITMPYENVDVNVHPNKWEVRFSDERGVRNAVETLIFEALNKQGILENTPNLFSSAALPDENTPPSRQPASITVSGTIQPDEPVESMSTAEKGPHCPESVPISRGMTEMAASSPLTDEKKPSNTKIDKASSSETDLGQNKPVSPSAGIIGLADLLRSITGSQHVTSNAANDSMPIDPVEIHPAQDPGLPGFAPEIRPAQSVSTISSEPSAPVSVTSASVSRVAEPNAEYHNEMPSVTGQEDLISTAGKTERAEVRYIGVVFNTYVLLEYQDRMLFCDQHAAHERLLYERLIRESEQNGVLSQELMIPLLIDLSPASYAIYFENIDLMREAGFDSEDFGDMQVKLLGVPVILGQPQVQRCFMDALDELARTGSYSRQDRISRIMQTACKHAIKGGEEVNPIQLTGLIRSILEARIPPTCPHGRPLFIDVTKHDLEKRFKRIQD